ncbi:hypothetical protein GCM10007320_66340 [Pseudorhodoferax aquiterrae]|uniref:Uncharacterized protein n=1 Tax=Pseudorhodoferax aquiterrae TaxID=747304 RepID=A0ABQ3GI01_9BURK|nr:hypothetical protein GCM10007320_66340 [Pseudorhodoferax aquiterrae]
MHLQLENYSSMVAAAKDVAVVDTSDLIGHDRPDSQVGAALPCTALAAAKRLKQWDDRTPHPRLPVVGFVVR